MDFVNARRVVNGTDRAADIALYARKYLAALEADAAVAEPPGKPSAASVPIILFILALILGWLWRRVLEVGGWLAAIIPLFMAMPPEHQAVIIAILSGQGGQLSIGAAFGFAVYIISQVMSFRTVSAVAASPFPSGWNYWSGIVGSNPAF